MMNKLDRADIWLINEIASGLMGKYGVKKNEADKLIKSSNFMYLLQTMPEQVHHETPNSWVSTIARQMKLKEMAY